MRGITSSAVLLALCVAGLLVFPPAVGGQDCPLGCGQQITACLVAARATKLACKLDCRQNPDLTARGACRRSCVEALRSARVDCQGGLLDCVERCGPPVPDGCLAACGLALGGCAADVVSDGRTCLAGCRTAADRLGCLSGCALQARAGAFACAHDFVDCVTRCGGPPPSTSTTTLVPRFCGLDPTLRVCAGYCPFGLVCVPPPPESMIALACICVPPASPSGAFVD
jgi:hypothetical protein